MVTQERTQTQESIESQHATDRTILNQRIGLIELLAAPGPRDAERSSCHQHNDHAACVSDARRQRVIMRAGNLAASGACSVSCSPCCHAPFTSVATRNAGKNPKALPYRVCRRHVGKGAVSDVPVPLERPASAHVQQHAAHLAHLWRFLFELSQASDQVKRERTAQCAARRARHP